MRLSTLYMPYCRLSAAHQTEAVLAISVPAGEIGCSASQSDLIPHWDKRDQLCRLASSTPWAAGDLLLFHLSCSRAPTRSSNSEGLCCGAYIGYWHEAAFRCGANVWTLLEAKRTCREGGQHVDPTRLTHKRHWPSRNPAAQQYRGVLFFSSSRGGTGTVRRREFITLLGGAAATWPRAARAQQIPVIGFLSSRSPGESAGTVAAFQRGLGETGYVDGRNVAIDYRFADGQYDRLPALASEVVRRPASIIVAAGPPAALAAKVATTTVPIVFVVGFDPVGAGLVASFNRPGGNATGVVLVSGQLGQKRLELVRDLVPKAATVAMLANPVSPDAVPEIREVQAAAQANGLQLRMLNASTLA